jgi:hypothetical protein
VAKRVVFNLTPEQARAYVRNRDRRKRAEDRAVIRAVFLQATSEERAELVERLGWNPLAEE